jgi:beta-lactam-binding protein with PASTA domain
MRLFRFLVRALVLFVVFVASVLAAMRFAIHGRQTTIPKLVGLTESQAQRLLADHGLVLDVGDRYFSSDVLPGRVMSQVPAPGIDVRRGWHVRVAESMGPQRAVIPNLIGNSERTAEMNIRRRGLELGSVAMAAISGAAPDQIVAQSPSANAVNVSEPKIGLLLAASEDRPSFVVPDLVGRSEDDAVNAIVNAGLRLSRISTQPAAASQENAAQGSRVVVSTQPAAGQRVYQGQGIGLQVTQ